LTGSEESLAIEQRSDRAQGAAQVQTALGWVALEQGLHGEAEKRFNDGLSYWCSIGRKPRIAETLEGLAVAAASQERMEVALHLVGAADRLWEAMASGTHSLIGRRWSSG
jgi:uncharacterized protein HemY